MSVKIEKKIVGYDIIKPMQEEKRKPKTSKNNTSLGTEESVTIVQMHEKVARPDILMGSTYKISPPVSEHAFYITINDMLLNPGTLYEKRRPFEIFINSKNMDHYQWIAGLTLIVSAVFRKGGDVTFLVDELKSVFDPKGGYFKRGGKFMPSLVAEIGETIEAHLKIIGMIANTDLDQHQQALVDQKRKEFEEKQVAFITNEIKDKESYNVSPEGAILCVKCNIKASILMDGCMTCLNCGDSKCG